MSLRIRHICTQVGYNRETDTCHGCHPDTPAAMVYVLRWVANAADFGYELTQDDTSNIRHIANTIESDQQK